MGVDNELRGDNELRDNEWSLLRGLTNGKGRLLLRIGTGDMSTLSPDSDYCRLGSYHQCMEASPSQWTLLITTRKRVHSMDPFYVVNHSW